LNLKLVFSAIASVYWIDRYWRASFDQNQKRKKGEFELQGSAGAVCIPRVRLTRRYKCPARPTGAQDDTISPR
jgi:hypothetical protein